MSENKIELFNSIIGKESIKVNGNVVSSKFSMRGTEHHFKLIEGEAESNCKIVTGLGLNGVVIDFYKNGAPVIESPKNGFLGFLLIIIVVVVTIGLLDKLF